MIQRVLHKTGSVLLAFLVLFSTLSFTVESHYCAGELVDVAIFSDVKKCDSEIPSADREAIKKPCCKDEVKLVKGQDELKLNTFDKLDFTKIVFQVIPVFDYINLFDSLPKQIIPFKDYSPPNLVYDIQVLDQVFII